MSGIDRRHGTGVTAPVNAPDLLTELERIRLEQAKTNELLRQILTPLAFISSCCAAMLDHLQRLAASCNTAVALLEDCSRTLRAVLYDTSNMAALFSAAAAAASHEGLLHEHAAHAARGMNLAVAACLMAGATVGLPYRWRACRVAATPPGGPWVSGSGLTGLWDRLSRDWRQPSAQTAASAAAAAGGSAAAAGIRGWLTAPKAVARSLSGGVGGGGPAVPYSWPSAWFRLYDGASGRPGADGWSSWGSSGGGGSALPWRPPRRWWWWWWGVGGREASVLVCRTWMTGGFLLGSLILALWTAARCYLARSAAEEAPHRRSRHQAPAAAAAAAGSAKGGAAGSRRRQPRCWTLLTSLPLLEPPLPQAKLQQPLLVGNQPLSLSSAAATATATMAAAAGYDGERHRWLLPGGGGGDGGGCAALPLPLRRSMWRRSAGLVLLHSPAWLPALTVMGGSPAAWLLLQLTWHAVLPYALMSLVAGAAAAEAPAVAAAAACDGALPCRTCGVPVNGAHDGGFDETVQDDDVQRGPGRGGVVQMYGMQSERASGTPDPGPAAAAAAGAAGEACAVEGAEEDVDSSGSSSSNRGSSGDGGGGGRRGFACGLFGLRSRFGRSGSGSIVGSQAASGSRFGAGSGSGSKVGYNRSQQLRASRHRASPSTTPGSASTTPAAVALAAAAAGTGAVAAGVPTAAAPSSSKPKAPAGPPPPVGSPPAPPQRTVALQRTPRPLPLLPGPAAPKPGPAAMPIAPTWISGAAARTARPLLAVLWLYGGPLVLGAAPVLPRGWLTGRLTSSAFLMTAVCCLAALAAVRATMARPTVSRVSAVASSAASAAPADMNGSRLPAAASASPPVLVEATHSPAAAAAATSPGRPMGHATVAVSAAGAACGVRR